MRDAIALCERIAGRTLDLRDRAGRLGRRAAHRGRHDADPRASSAGSRHGRARGRPARAVGVGVVEGGRAMTPAAGPRADPTSTPSRRSTSARYAGTRRSRAGGCRCSASSLGVVIGYALSLGGGKVYEAQARVYLGNPFSPNGGATVPSLATNPSTVSEIVRSEAR